MNVSNTSEAAVSLPDPSKENSPSPAQIGLHVLSVPFLRNIFIACLAVALLFPLYSWFYLTPSYRKMISTFSEEDAQRASTHLIRVLKIGDRPISATQPVSDDLARIVTELRADFQLDKLKLFDPAGTVVFSTDPQEIGQVNDKSYFTQSVARGRTHSRVVAKGGRSQEGQSVIRDVVEIYVPVMKGKSFLGAFEIYYDITAEKQNLESLLGRNNIVLVSIAITMMIIVVAVLNKAGSAMLSHGRMDQALQEARDQLEKQVEDRTVDLIDANKDLQMEILERRQAEEDRRESEKRFRNLIQTIPHGIQEIDPDGTITFANPAHTDIYGYDPDKLVGKSMFHLASGEDERVQLQEHLQYLFKHQPHPSPWYSKDRTQQGRIIDTQVDWNYKRDVQGRVLGLIAVISDITHRKQAEKALLDNLQFMNTLIDTIPNPVFYKDAEGLFLGCNLAFAQTLGLSKEEILGRRLNDLDTLITSDMAEHYHRQDLVLIQNPGVRSHEAQIHCADGVRRDYVFYNATFQDTGDQVAGLVGIMLDITARKKVEKALEESKNLFDAFMLHLPGLAFMKDLENRYIYVNEAFSQFTATVSGTQIGRHTDQVWPAETARMLQANDEKVRLTQKAESSMESVRLPDGQERHLLTARFPIYQDEELFALGGISIDITQRTVAQRKRQQLELQLQQAQKMEALGTLAGGIAHDFNNILASIIGFTEIAVADIQKESPAHDYLKHVLSAGERARALVKQILAFSRQGDMEPKPVQVKLIVKEVLKLLRATLPATIEIVQEIHTDSAVMADPTQIHQVMLNLGTNAGYAMSEKGGHLTVRLEKVSMEQVLTCQHGDLPPGQYLKLTVVDTGHGIAAEDIGRIFDPFFTTKPKGEGTGMGLAVVHGIITGLNGAILVNSKPGQGATFEVYLPAILEDVKIAPAPKEALPVGIERILFVDDEPFQTNMLKHMLGLLGYKVQACNRGAEALELFQQDPEAFDLVITDMIMPEMTGDEMARRMLEIRPDLRIILATGYSEKITEAKAKAMGIKAYALKPLVMEELANLIRDVLDNPVG